MTTLVRARYFPASVQLPDEPRPRSRVYVVLAEGGDFAGLHVFSRPEMVGDVVLPIDWSLTRVPHGRGARNGIDVHLVGGGLAVVTAGAGCKCGALGRWAGPAWAHSVTVNAQ